MSRLAPYDWDSWLKLKSVVLLSGQDFTVPVRSFVALAHQVANRRGLAITTSTKVVSAPASRKRGKGKVSPVPAIQLTITMRKKVAA